MCATAANLVEHVLPAAALRQWVLTVPFAWRKRLGYDGPVLGALVRKFADAVLSFYRRRAEKTGLRGQSGAVLVLQRTSSDLRLNPHVHAVFLDGVYSDGGENVTFHPLGRLSTAEVEGVLEDAVARMTRYLQRRGLLEEENDDDTDSDREASGLAALAVSGMTPPGGPTFRRGTLPLPRSAQDFARHLAVGRGGFTLHAATRAGAADERGCETLLKFVLRPPIAQERITRGPDGLVRIVLKKAFSDGTIAVDLDPLSLLTRLCAAVPPPRFHTVRYVGVLASASKLRPRIVPTVKCSTAGAPQAGVDDGGPSRAKGRYRPWAELLKRTFSFDVLACRDCGSRLRLVAMLTEAASITRYLRALGEPVEAPSRSPPRGPPYWASRALRRRAGDVDAA